MTTNFVFNADYDFKGRFAGEPDYFGAKCEQNGFLLARISSPTPSIFRSSAPRSAAPAAVTSASTWPRARCRATFPNSRSAPTRRRQPWAGRARDRALRRGLFADVAGRRGAEALRLAGRQLIVPPNNGSTSTSIPGRHRRAISRSSMGRTAQFAGRADRLDQPPHRRRPDRLRRRTAGNPLDVCRRCSPATA